MVYTVDDFGNMLDENNQYVGYYDDDLKMCLLFDGSQVQCPQGMKEPKQKIEVKSTQTFYWVALVGAILFIILIGFLINRE